MPASVLDENDPTPPQASLQRGSPTPQARPEHESAGWP